MFYNWVFGIFVEEIRAPVLFGRNFSRKCMGTCACVFSPRRWPHTLRSLMSLPSTFFHRKKGKETENPVLFIIFVYVFINVIFQVAGKKGDRH